MLAIWSLVSLPFLNHLKYLEVHGSCTIEAWLGEFWALLCYCVRWMQLYSSLNILWHCLSLGLEWKLIFSRPVATAEFSRFAGILNAALSERHLLGFENSSTGIPSPPLALFALMLPKAYLASHSRLSGSRWVITPSLVSGSWRSCLYGSSVYSCHLLISSASVMSIPFLSFIVSIFAWNVPLIYLIFLKRSLVFPILLFSSISLHWSLRKAFFSLFAILWNSAFKWVYLSFSPLPFASFPVSAICKALSGKLFAFLFLGDGLDQCLLYNVTNLHP